MGQVTDLPFFSIYGYGGERHHHARFRDRNRPLERAGFRGSFLRLPGICGPWLPEIGPERFTLMPWLAFSQLSEEDLKAIYAYLRTQKAIRHSVDSHPGVEPPTQNVARSDNLWLQNP